MITPKSDHQIALGCIEIIVTSGLISANITSCHPLLHKGFS
ncbi:hypothetical protein VCHA28FP16_310005 [Vibrio chagasii]|nr:hypothetical protein VCHA28FP16_310005 [Vibrio chagasii]